MRNSGAISNVRPARRPRSLDYASKKLELFASAAPHPGPLPVPGERGLILASSSFLFNGGRLVGWRRGWANKRARPWRLLAPAYG